MNITETLRGPFALRPSSKLAALLIVALVLWMTGAPTFLKQAEALSLVDVSDTLSDSDLSAVSNHTIAFTIQNALDATDQIYIDLDPTGNNFTVGMLDSTSFVGETGATVVAACGGGASEFTVATTSEDITLTLCASDTVATSTVISLPIIGVITNPSAASSYVIHIQTENGGSTILDQADTRVAIIDDVVVTASVDTTFTFTIGSLAGGTDVNGVTTSTSSNPTTIQFGTLAPATPVTIGQQLTVETNAANGFVVTVHQDQNLTSATGADIDLFIDGAETATPVAWQAPAGTLGSENTYGHFGVTSEDSDLQDDVGADGNFGASLFAGNLDTARPVFAHDGPSDGAAVDIGLTQVAYRVEIDSLQEAGTDYTNTLTYVATPTF